MEKIYHYIVTIAIYLLYNYFILYIYCFNLLVDWCLSIYLVIYFISDIFRQVMQSSPVMQRSRSNIFVATIFI